MHACIICLSIDPSQGSEPGRAFRLAERIILDPRISRYTLIAPAWRGNIQRITAEFSKLTKPGEIIPVNYLSNSTRIHETPLRYLLYFIMGWTCLRALAKVRDPDILHQLNFAGFRFATPFFFATTKSVWGPISAAAYFPLRTAWPYLSPSGRLYYFAYNVANWLQLHFSVLPNLALRRVRAVLFATSEDLRLLKRNRQNLLNVHMPEIATAIKGARKSQTGHPPFRLAWAGVHIDRKGLPLLLKALETLDPAHKEQIQVIVFGVGRLTERWRRLAQRLGVSIEWKGSLPRPEFLDALQQCDALLITSFREANSNVLAEARERGLAIIALETSGYYDLVGGIGEWLVPLHEQELHQAYKHRIEALIEFLKNQQPSIACTLAPRTALRSEQEQAKQIVDIYEAIQSN